MSFSSTKDEDCLYLNVWSPMKAPQQPLPVEGERVDLHPLVYPVGIPKTTVPYLQQVVEKVQDLAKKHRVIVSPDEWTALPQRLLGNYRAIAGSGLVVPLGDAEVLFRLNPSEAYVADDPASVGVQPAPDQAVAFCPSNEFGF